MERNDAALAIPIKDQADLTWLLIETVESGLLDGATELGISQVKTIVSELGTNIIKYAGRGVLSLKRLETDGAIDVVIQATDSGPGIPDIDLAMRDAYSTGNSLGLGLPSVRRLSDAFSITSQPGQGTQIEVRKRLRAPPARHAAIARLTATTDRANAQAARPLRQVTDLYDLGAYVRPMPGEVVSGDLVHVERLGQGLLIAVADASGHGAKAAAVADQIRDYLGAHASADLHRLMAGLHDRLRGTLGAAVALLHVDLLTGVANFCAVGNATCQRAVGDPWRPISKDGVLGQRLPTLIRQSAHLRNADLLLMSSDGLSELSSRNFAADNAHLPADKLAVDLVTALGRPFDDACCVVFKWIA